MRFKRDPRRRPPESVWGAFWTPARGRLYYRSDPRGFVVVSTTSYRLPSLRDAWSGAIPVRLIKRRLRFVRVYRRPSVLAPCVGQLLEKLAGAEGSGAPRSSQATEPLLAESKGDVSANVSVPTAPLLHQVLPSLFELGELRKIRLLAVAHLNEGDAEFFEAGP